jgi:hypothetical protein
MPPLTITTADAALKQIYVPGYMNDVCYKDRPLLAMLPKYEKFGGRNMPIVLEYGHPAGRSQVFATAQANAQPSQFEDFLLDRVHDYGVTQVDGETVDAMEGDAYAWVRGMTSQVNGILNQTARNAHIMAYRNGSGVRGVVLAGTGTNTLTLTNPEDAANFEVGMSIDGATGAGAPHGTPDTISAINRIAGTLVSTAATWNAAILNGDNLFVEGDYTAAASVNMLAGLEAWVPAAAPGAGLFFGVNRTFDATRLGGLRLNVAALTIEEGLNNGANLVASHGGTPTHCFLNYTNYQDLINSLGAKATYEMVQSSHQGLKGYIGFESCKIIGPKGPISVIPDNACPLDVGWMLQLDTWVCASLGPLPKILSHDGQKWLRVNNADQVEVRVGYYGNIGCKAPGYNCRLAL